MLETTSLQLKRPWTLTKTLSGRQRTINFSVQIVTIQTGEDCVAKAMQILR